MIVEGGRQGILFGGLCQSLARRSSQTAAVSWILWPFNLLGSGREYGLSKSRI